MRSVSALIIGGAACALLSPLAPAAQASVLSDWNLITRGNVSSTSEVDGSALIGGTLNGTSNYAVQGATAPGNVGLAVAGNVSSGVISVNNSSAFRYAGTVSTTVNAASSAFDGTVHAQVSAALVQATSISATLAALTTNGTLDGAGNMSAVPTLIAGQRVAVYSLTPAQWAGLGQLNLNFGTADSVIINVPTGGNISFVAPPNLLGGFSQANSSRILWNIPSATSISVNNTFNGALLALNADLRILGGGVNGTVVVNSISQQSAEIRRSNYTGFIPAPGAATLLALGGLVAARRRRTTSQSA